MDKIDFAKILKSKNPKLARLLPRFVIGWGEALLKVKRHNAILEKYSHLDAEGFIDGALDDIGVKYVLHGTENIPRGENHRALFISNHPLGGVDGIILATAIIKENIGGVRLIVNDLLLNIDPLKEVFVGVNKHGGQRSTLNKELDELYNSLYAMVNFPAGLCSRKIKGEIVDTQWKSGYVARAKRSGRIVVPTYVEARNSRWFYFFANLRKFLRVKSNLEMLLLPRQIYFQKNKTVNIYFGEPITIDDTHNSKEWNDLIRERVYNLNK